jgi:dipeptidyl aminopeptidase/acylaminoacyl peptidase
VTETITAPYGSWRSPITADLIVGDAVGFWLATITLDGEDTYWTEIRPKEQGRSVIVRCDAQGNLSDINPEPFSASTRVHEYGGGAFTVRDGIVYFSNFDDNRLYRQKPGAQPEPVTAADPNLRYADFIVARGRNRLIAVREDHSISGQEPVNTLVAINLDGGEQEVIAAGNDFYSNPRLSPDGTHLAYLSWNHPNMPWDGTDLWLAEVGTLGGVSNARRIAGGKREAIFQPAWSPDGTLYFVSDRTGWWNLYRRRGEVIEPVTQMEAELGTTLPMFGTSTYAFSDSGDIVAAVNSGGSMSLDTIDAQSGEMRRLDLPFTAFGWIQAQDGRAVFLAGSPTMPSSVVQLDLRSVAFEVLKPSRTVPVDEAYLSRPEPIEFPTENGKTAYGLYYAPRNKDYAAPAGEQPPLIVSAHGGPIDQTTATLNLGLIGPQFWTSRGFAVVDVNYGGSSGYGREFRERIYGQWGVVDVDDSVNAARYLAQEGKADENRLIIHGGSAGGYTTLAALAFKDVFAAGASYFGLADLEAWVRTTHKFEAHFLDQLVGPYPECADLYHDRSPVTHADRIDRPVILFQGLEDRVVPPQQAEIIVEALERRGIPYAYMAYEGEGHGFRRAENIKRTLTDELYFYSRVFGLELPDKVPPVDIRFQEKLPIGGP